MLGLLGVNEYGKPEIASICWSVSKAFVIRAAKMRISDRRFTALRRKAGDMKF